MTSKRTAIPLTLLLAAALLLPGDVISSGGANAAGALNQDPGRVAAAGRVMFIENIGQFADGARFQVWAGPGTLWLAEDAIWISIVERSNVDVAPSHVEPGLAAASSIEGSTSNRVNLRLSFPNANPQPRLEPFDRLDTHVSYFMGADPEQLHVDVPVWGGVRYVDLYPGLDLEITGEGGQWQWRLTRGKPRAGQCPKRQGTLSAIRMSPSRRGRGRGGGGRRWPAPVHRAEDLLVPLLKAAGLPTARCRWPARPVRPATYDVAAPFADGDRTDAGG